jgi:hypothetical protein
MIRTRQKCPDALSRNIDTPRPSRRGVFRRAIELCFRFIKDLQRRSQEVLLRRLSEERTTLLNSQSQAVIARRPANEDPFASAREKEGTPGPANTAGRSGKDPQNEEAISCPEVKG